jgi:hypothetical protein
VVCFVFLVGCLAVGAVLYVVFGAEGLVSWAARAFPIGDEPYRSAAGIVGVCLLLGMVLPRVARRRDWSAQSVKKALALVWVASYAAWLAGGVAFGSGWLTGRLPPPERAHYVYGMQWRGNDGRHYVSRDDGKVFKASRSGGYWVEVRGEDRRRALSWVASAIMREFQDSAGRRFGRTAEGFYLRFVSPDQGWEVLGREERDHAVAAERTR